MHTPSLLTGTSHRPWVGLLGPNGSKQDINDTVLAHKPSNACRFVCAATVPGPLDHHHAIAGILAGTSWSNVTKLQAAQLLQLNVNMHEGVSQSLKHVPTPSIRPATVSASVLLLHPTPGHIFDGPDEEITLDYVFILPCSSTIRHCGLVLQHDISSVGSFKKSRPEQLEKELIIYSAVSCRYFVDFRGQSRCADPFYAVGEWISWGMPWQ